MSVWRRLDEALDPRRQEQVRRIVSMGRGFDERAAEQLVAKFYATGRAPEELDSLIDRYRVGGDPGNLRAQTPATTAATPQEKRPGPQVTYIPPRRAR